MSNKKEKQKEKQKEKNGEETVEADIEEPKKSKEQEYIETIQHLQADFENYRKRVERDQVNFCKFAGQSLIEKLLPALDNFELILTKGNKDNHTEFVKATEMVYSEIFEVLEKQGLKRINAKGKLFNPEIHEPLLQEESDEPPNTVLEVLQQGYTLNDKVIRHSRVKIAKARENK